MFITKRHISRRTLLRGAGATLGLPLLDAMLPALTPLAKVASLHKTRLACVEIVHGAAGSTLDGTSKHYWSPSKEGTDFEFTQTLSPLEKYRNYLTVISNTDLNPAGAYAPSEEGGDHFRSSAAFLTASHPKMTESSDIFAGTSLDQIYAAKVGQDTPLPSIQLCIEDVDATGACAYGYACVYSDTISWASPTQPLPMTLDPRVAFENLFGDGSTAEERADRRSIDRSILDGIVQQMPRLRADLGSSDRARLDSYLEDLREIERRIQNIEKFNTTPRSREALPKAPLGVPESYEEHVKLMFDLQVLAFMTDTTRVSAFKMSRDVNQRVFPGSGVTTPFHSCSHHGESPAHIAEFAKINLYHVTLLGYFLDKLAATADGDGTLLDHSLVLYGSPMGDSNVHNHKRVPMLLAGHANGTVRGNYHLRTPDGTPTANIYQTVLSRLGIDVRSIGDSTGQLSI
ncbi:MAG TPA: DUF1552 domain-containing protein [Edaphobacter sp.]|nr:DUF1552 domain-containing protein [Edaphobacter sp.]